ncbi:MAG TPA: hypothetical protein PKO06_22740, partial [Candidatus Ozemobacteraceae bacterium]|nr:hypothetical protein [Candidatus Ozemobacteraceae bacterium]
STGAEASMFVSSLVGGTARALVAGATHVYTLHYLGASWRISAFAQSNLAETFVVVGASTDEVRVCHSPSDNYVYGLVVSPGFATANLYRYDADLTSPTPIRNLAPDLAGFDITDFAMSITPDGKTLGLTSCSNSTVDSVAHAFFNPTNGALIQKSISDLDTGAAFTTRFGLSADFANNFHYLVQTNVNTVWWHKISAFGAYGAYQALPVESTAHELAFDHEGRTWLLRQRPAGTPNSLIVMDQSAGIIDSNSFVEDDFPIGTPHTNLAYDVVTKKIVVGLRSASNQLQLYTFDTSAKF